jgi:putative transcriptional regulator
VPETVNGLRALRESRGWSQGRLAKTLGDSRQPINAIETGGFDPSLPLAIRLAHTFGRTVEDIFILKQ